MTKTNAIDVVKGIQDYLDNTEGRDDALFVDKVFELMAAYEKTAKEEQVEIDNLSQEQFDDKVLQGVATQYGLTMNQVVGLLDMCEKMNEGHLTGTGVTVVPFWFHQQYVELQKQNEKLIVESENLVETIARVREIAKKHEYLGVADVLEERSSIITGHTKPYIPGVTGPRVGDEHLDGDNVYIPPHMK